MLKTYLYIPDHLDKKIKIKAKAQNKSKAEVIRQALEKGLGERNEERNDAQVLLDLSKEIRESLKGEKLPRDLSVNHDYYLWGMPKRDPKAKP